MWFFIVDCSWRYILDDSYYRGLFFFMQELSGLPGWMLQNQDTIMLWQWKFQASIAMTLEWRLMTRSKMYSDDLHLFIHILFFIQNFGLGKDKKIRIWIESNYESSISKSVQLESSFSTLPLQMIQFICIIYLPHALIFIYYILELVGQVNLCD